jgi:hypothetical protein
MVPLTHAVLLPVEPRPAAPSAVSVG